MIDCSPLGYGGPSMRPFNSLVGPLPPHLAGGMGGTVSRGTLGMLIEDWFITVALRYRIAGGLGRPLHLGGAVLPPLPPRAYMGGGPPASLAGAGGRGGGGLYGGARVAPHHFAAHHPHPHPGGHPHHHHIVRDIMINPLRQCSVLTLYGASEFMTDSIQQQQQRTFSPPSSVVAGAERRRAGTPRRGRRSSSVLAR